MLPALTGWNGRTNLLADMLTLTPDLMLRAYANGIFPMAEDADDDELFWLDPPERAILPLDTQFHVPRSLAKFMRRMPFTITTNQAFAQVIHGCAEKRPERPETWINRTIIDTFTSLHQRGHAHSVEAWHDGHLVGGLYGVSIGSAFFAESMFSRVSNASRVCVVKLVEHLRDRDFQLCDVQFTNDHILQFGVYEISRAEYHTRLQQACAIPAQF